MLIWSMTITQKPLMMLFLILTLLFLFSSSAMSNTDYFIACGIPKSATTTLTSQDGTKTWQSDDNPAFAPPDINKISSGVVVIGDSPPYTGVRIFETPVMYSIPVSPGPKFLRLYFTTTTPYTYNNASISASQFFLSVEANGFTLLHNFSAFLNSNSQYMFYEFHLTVQKGQTLNLTFSSAPNYPGFINGFEIITMPEGLYLNRTRTPTLLLDCSSQQDKVALQLAYRINVGGSPVSSVDDSGSLGRAWDSDRSYIIGNFFGTTVYFHPTDGPIEYAVNYTPKVPSYVAPKIVYATVRFMGLNGTQGLRKNLTWRFDVDPGFDYLVRLHFCEMNDEVTGSLQRVFEVYINNETAEEVDVFQLSGGRGFAMFRDYVVSFYGESNGTKVPLWLALHPKDSSDGKFAVTDVLLNGVEILKLSPSNGNLAVPNPPSSIVPVPSPVHRRSPAHHTLPIVGGAIGGAILASILIFVYLDYKRKAKHKEKWAPYAFDSLSNTSTANSSLPSDLCRRFSLVHIRVATCDFDENLIIGTGGFGKVYKGSIDGGTTTVAIKRLNTTSKQGANEFQTEIEMLSRLRHMHLVSLIGYCEDQGEMILVYEYMPRGTLRDHLLYKNPTTNDHYNRPTPLSWKQRLMICIGSARGLHYLHAGAKHLIIHRDIKSTNILLDDNWTAKVSDFGLSKIGPQHNESGINHVSTAVKGSVGYLDPEYYRRQQLTDKSDVYSFGVMLFEVLSARPVVNPNLPREQANLAVWARSCYKSGILHTIMDPNLTGQIAPECLRKFGEIAEMCVRDRGSERPSMEDLVYGLEFSLQLQQTAEENNNDIGGDGTTVRGFLDPTIYNGDTRDEDLSTSSGNDFSQSSGSNSTTKRLLDSGTTMSNSSGSVFSNMVDPQDR